MIDWTRIARPQADGYDTTTLAVLEPLWTKLTPNPSSLTLCEGTVAIVPQTGESLMMGPNFLVAGDDVITPRLHRLDECLTGWDDGLRMLTAFLDELWPFWSLDMGEHATGCASGHHQCSPAQPVHAVYVTVNSPEGCAQGIYHEVAHLRLETLGIGIDTHDGRLLANHPDELYDSSVRHDKQRPMSAVLHGVYAWLMFTENDYQLQQKGILTNMQWQVSNLHNLPKLERGLHEVQQFARWTTDGLAFADGLYTWTNDLLNRTHILAQDVVPANEYKRVTMEYAR